MLSDIALYIWTIFPPCLLVLGTFGNVITIIVLMKRKNSNSSIARYLTTLAVSDLTFLSSSLSRHWLFYAFRVDIRGYSEFICKVQVFLIHISAQSSICMVVAVTIERFFATWLPFKQRTTCTSRRASIVIICVTSTLVLLNLHIIYGMTTSNDHGCYPFSKNYAKFYFDSWPKIQFVTFSFIPLAILFTLNISIIIRMSVVRRRAKRTIVPQAINQIEGANRAKNHNITVMLVALGIVYMISVTPFLVFLLLYTDWVLSRDVVPENNVLEIVWVIVNVLLYTNNAVNFLLYFQSRTSFRKEATKIIKSLFVCRREQ